MCVLLITRLFRLVERLSFRKPIKPHQLTGCCYSNWPSSDGPHSLCNRSLWWYFLCCHVAFNTPVFRRDVLWYGDVRPTLRPSGSPSVRFPHFSSTCFDILSCNFAHDCFNVLQIKFDCRDFVSIFEGVMPLFELRMLEMCSFPHFSLTCFDISSWNFAYYLFLMYNRSKLSVVIMRQFLRSYGSFWT